MTERVLLLMLGIPLQPLDPKVIINSYSDGIAKYKLTLQKQILLTTV